MSKVINFALIGTGNMAEKHIAVINAVKRANLLGVLSLNDLNKSKKIASKYNVKLLAENLSKTIGPMATGFL